MAASKLRLRPWQRRALDRYLDSEEPDFLAVATPGAGKTTFALTAARMTLPGLSGRLVIVAPTKHLKEQWADAAERFGLMLDTEWNPSGGLPSDVHGVVTTYQQVGSSAMAFRTLSEGGFVILDEIHHAGDERAWGDGVRVAFSGAAKRMSLSGTPFRSDTRSIPFVRYEWDQVVPDIEYGYGDALADGRVVRPVFFPRFGGHMEWVAPDGAELSASFDDELARTQANQRLRAALSLQGEWLPAVIGQAHEQLTKIRTTHENAGGLVIAMDQEHAQAIASLLRRRYGVQPIVAVSDDPQASAKITQYANSTSEWIVAVRMVSEGVDIPRLRVAVFATTTTTELFFRQAVGRIVRWTRGAGRQRAYLFMPDDPRLRHYGQSIAEARRHLLKKKEDDESSEFDDAELDEVSEDPGEEQLSLFSVLSSTVGDVGHGEDIFDDSTDDGDDDDETDDAETDPEQAELFIDLQRLPPPGPGPLVLVSRKDRERLREQNAEIVKELVAITGKTHAIVNSELNRMSGVEKVSTATAMQLSKRAKAGQDLLGKEHKRQRMSRFV